VLDDFSRYIVAWKLCTTMAAADVTATLASALQACGLDQAPLDPETTPAQRQRTLLPRDGQLADWLEEHGIGHTRGKPYHPMTQGKIERCHLSLKSGILLDNYYLPGTSNAPSWPSSITTTTTATTRASTISPRPISTSGAVSAFSTDDTRSNSAPSTIDADYTSQQQPDLNTMGHALP